VATHIGMGLILGVSHFQSQKVKVTRPLWLAVLAVQRGHRVSNRSRCMYDLYRVTTCRAGQGHIVATSRLQLIQIKCVSLQPCVC